MPPSLRETVTAAAALAAVSALLPELPELRIAWYDGPPNGPRGRYDGQHDPGTIHLRTGQAERELAETVRHETAHAALVPAIRQRQAPWIGTGRFAEGQAKASAWGESLAERFATGDRVAPGEIAAAVRAVAPVWKSAPDGWLAAQRRSAVGYACELVDDPTVRLSAAARAKHAATCAKHRDPAAAALSARMAGWDAAHRTAAAVDTGARHVTASAFALLRDRHRHVRAAAMELGMADAAVRDWSSSCKYDQLVRGPATSSPRARPFQSSREGSRTTGAA